MFNFAKFCQDQKIPTAPPGHKHQRRGWINIRCPLHQGSENGFHLGFNVEKSYFICYGCGYSRIETVISTLSDVKKPFLKGLIRSYSDDRPIPQPYLQPTIIRPLKARFPSGIGPLTQRHKDYLIGRNFDPLLLESLWGLMGTNAISYLDDTDYKFRIIAPVTFNRETVSFQGRDITGKATHKYKGCPDEAEVIPHKSLLYGYDEAKKGNCIVVEGVTGVWRLGPGAVGTFGVEFTKSQLKLLAMKFKKIFILYDPDEAGEKKSNDMYVELSAMGKEAIVLSLPEGTDSGDLPQKEADELIEEVTHDT